MEELRNIRKEEKYIWRENGVLLIFRWCGASRIKNGFGI